jgi:hypothetical protein
MNVIRKVKEARRKAKAQAKAQRKRDKKKRPHKLRAQGKKSDE